VEVSLDSMREELHPYAKNAGAMVGPITLVDSGDLIDCSRMGSRTRSRGRRNSI